MRAAKLLRPHPAKHLPRGRSEASSPARPPKVSPPSSSGTMRAAMWLPALGLLAGIVIGLIFSLSIPADYARYTAIAVLAGLDSILGAARAELEGQYDSRIFVSGLITNMLMAGLLTFLGDRLGVELYVAAIVAFGVRLFNNLGIIRRRLLFRTRAPSPPR
jgi:small basic protein